MHIVVHACDPNTWEVEAGKSDQGQPELHREFQDSWGIHEILSQKNRQTSKNPGSKASSDTHSQDSLTGSGSLHRTPTARMAGMVGRDGEAGRRKNKVGMYVCLGGVWELNTGVSHWAWRGH